VVAALEVKSTDQLMIGTDTGRVIRIAAGEVRLLLSRASMGVRLMRLEREERIVDVAVLPEEPVAEEGVEAEPEGEEVEAWTNGVEGPPTEPDSEL
jgi:DNA gyrase/topoisomerase IV subunit A